MARLELYLFSYYDSLKRCWMRARYKADLATIRERYGERHRLEGPPEIREVDEDPAARFPTRPG